MGRWVGRLFTYEPPEPPEPSAVSEGTATAWCSNCDEDREMDVIPPHKEFDIPPFVVCMFCGWSCDVDLPEPEEAA